MQDLGMHIVFFLFAAFAIVVMGTFYANPSDATAFRAVPRRFFVFVLSCAGVAAAMKLVEMITPLGTPVEPEV